MRELEILGVAAADGLAGPIPAKPGDGPKHANLHPECLNCGVTLHGRYCSNCGQTDDDHHRSIFALAWEVVEDFTHLDGRLAKTLPPLFINPGKLVRDHLEGRRQRHVPPFRLFLVTLLLFMLSLEVVTHHEDLKPAEAKTPTPPGVNLTVGQTPKKDLGSRTYTVGGGLITVHADTESEAKSLRSPDDALAQVATTKQGKSPLGQWFITHLKKALDNKALFRNTIFEWGHRLAITLLPIFAGLLTLFYFYKRRFYVYDHLVVAMHFLSFTFLLWGVAYLVPEPVNGLAILAATIWTPANLFMTLRGAYGSSIVGAVVKALSLSMATLVLFLGLLVGVIVLALGTI